MAEELLTTVPEALKRLVKLTTNAIYTTEDVAIINILLVHPCLKEDDLYHLLKFERNQLGIRLAILQKDRIIKVKMCIEMGAENDKQVDYYYIDYRSFVNVVRYKMDMMLKILCKSQKHDRNMFGYKCVTCSKTYTEQQLNELINFNTSELKCSSCSGFVILVESDGAAITMLKNKFNIQFEPLLILLKEVQDMKLSSKILKPKPSDIAIIKDSANNNTRKRARSSKNAKLSGKVTRSSTIDQTCNEVRISEVDYKNNATVITKEQPIWFTQASYVNSSDIYLQRGLECTREITVIDVPGETNKCTNKNSDFQNNSNNQNNPEDIMSLLLTYEDQYRKLKVCAPEMRKFEDSTFQDEMIDCSDDDENIPVVNIGTRVFKVTEIYSDLIEAMTTAEKDEHVRVFQDYFEMEFF